MACICERTVILEPNGDWDCLKNEDGIAVKESVQLACGHDEDGFYLTATGYDEEANWHPFFCPICGRKLRPNDATFQTIKGRYWENYDHRR